MKPHEETWSVKGCGNDGHGPHWTCWKVVDGSGAVILKGVDKGQAERYAAIPDLAKALLNLLPHHSFITTKDEAERVTAAQDVLRRLGALP